MAKMTESNRDVTHICQDLAFCPLDDMKYEPKEIDHYTMMYSIASKHQGIGVLVKVDRSDIKPEFIEGAACNACWSVGKAWENETVPRYVLCALSGFSHPVEFLNAVYEPGDPIKPGVYLLIQKNAPGCTYEYLDDTKEIIWTPDDTLSTILVKTKPDNIIRMNTNAGGCFKRFEEDCCRAEIVCC